MSHNIFQEIGLIMNKACIHGRFQPFHLEHLQYFLKAFEKYDFLYIGITKPNIDNLSKTDYHDKIYRDDPGNNIFTYDQRCKIIEYSLVEKGISRNRFSFLPFDIDQIETITLPKNIICVSNIVEAWNEHKLDKLKNSGYQVDILYKNLLVDKMSSTKIRESIKGKADSWKQYIPNGAITIIEEILKIHK